MKTALIAALAAGIVLPAAAQNIVATDPQGVLAWFQDEGFPSKLEKDGADDPIVTVRYYDSDFSVYFYGCQQNTDCTSLQFFSGYRMDGEISTDQVNEWNAERLFSRAYITEAGAARLEYDVFTGNDGVTPDDFDEIVSLWTSAQSDFEDFIDW